MVLEQLDRFDGSAMAVLGTPEKASEYKDAKGHRIVSHLSTHQLQQAVANANVIVSRSGYSTVMDLSVMGKKAVFVPTPGQTEQEYLARMFHSNRRHYRMLQGNFNLQKALKEVETYAGFEARPSVGYRSAVDALLTSLS
jgi:UDP-N-acetylglucosamine:LPS N-acetylglucosamine transferase